MKVERSADLRFHCGGTGSGKSFEQKRLIERRAPPRLIVIDPDGEYDGCGYLNESVADFYKATCFPVFRARLRPSFVRSVAEREFDLVCQMVRWHVDPQPHQAPPPRVAPLTFVVDELADYVGPSFRDAPESWQWIIRRGRKYGVTLFAASQRPAQIDKTFFDLATTIRTGRLNNDDSQVTVAHALGVSAQEVRALTGYAWIERDKNSGRHARGDERGRSVTGRGATAPARSPKS